MMGCFTYKEKKKKLLLTFLLEETTRKKLTKVKLLGCIALDFARPPTHSP